MLCIFSVLAFASCTSPSASAPAPEPMPAPIPALVPTPATPSHPASLEEVTPTELRNQIVILEMPTEAHIGDYITVRIKTMSNEYWDWLKAELINASRWDALGCYGEEATYDLVLVQDWPGMGTYEHSLGLTTPDDKMIVSWYSAIPTEGGAFQYNPETERYEWKKGRYPLVTIS